MYLLFKKKMVWPSKPIFHLISTVHCNYVARKSKEKIESSIYSVCLRHKFANSLEKKSTKTLVCLNILFVYIGSQTICMQFTQSKRLIHCFRGTSILGEVRNVEIPGPTQKLLCSKYHDFIAIFALAHSKINQIAQFLDDNVRNYVNFLFKP